MAANLVRDLTPTEVNARKAAQGFKPREGRKVSLWRMGGEWHVWSPGPEVSTWWLTPANDEAREIYSHLVASQGSGAPVVKTAMQGAICVRTVETKALR